MAEYDKFKHNVAFHSLCNLIKNKEDLNSNSTFYFQWAKEFFGEISKSLDSRLNPEKEEGYYFMEPSIERVVSNYGKDISKMSVQEIKNMKNKFESISNNLEKFEMDASGFYKTQEAKQTFNVLIRFLPKDVGFSAYELFDEKNSGD